MKVAREASELGLGERAIAVGDFDGVHRGHQAVLAAARDSGLDVAVVTWQPAAAERGMLCSLERRLELLEAEEVPEVVLLGDAAEARRAVESLTATVVIDAGDIGEAGRELVREALAAGDVARAAELLRRPPEVEGRVVRGDERGRTLGFPTANVEVPRGLVIPVPGIYAGWAAGTRAAISIGTNPTYGGEELRVEAFLLDFEGDLYGRRLVVELWARLRDEVAFASEEELVEQIAADVSATREASRPA